MIHNNVTDFTSEEQSADARDQLWLGFTGAGSVTVEIRARGDSTFRAYPEFTLSAPAAKVLPLVDGRYRIKVTGGPANVTAIKQ